MRRPLCSSDLAGARILVLENEYYLATDLRDALEQCGGVVCGPFGEDGPALDAVVAERPDVALIDVNLGQGASFAVPRRLVAESIPFAFVTGYDRWAIPAEFADVPRVEKPADMAAICRAAAGLLGRDCG